MEIRPHAETDPDKPAIIMHPSGSTVSFGELEMRANRLAHFFRRAGLREGDTIAVVMENNVHLHAVMWAARRCGLYYAMINTHLTVPEAAYIVTSSGAHAIFGSPATRHTCEGLTDDLRDGLPGLRLIVHDELHGWQTYPECVADQPGTAVLDEREGDLLQYSSGTTGRPKGIRRALSHLPPAEAPNPLAPFLGAVGITREAVYLSPAPLYHTAPSMWSMAAQALGASTVVMEKFDPEQALAAIQRHRVTHGQFVPAMFVRMLKLPEHLRNSYDVSSLQRVVHAAASCPVEIKRQMMQWWGPIVDEFYSSSEGAGATFIGAHDWLAHPGSVGKPLLGVAHILGEDGNELPAGEPGQIYFDGGYSFEYLNDAEKTSASVEKHGWATVGDVGYLDDEGYLYLTDRRHHMIISGGVNIYPQETENMLVTHPKVLDAAVFGIPDEDMGQSVKAAVQTVDAADATDEFAVELLDWLRGRLAHYKCPRSIAFEVQLPRTDTGKLYKQELVKKYSVPSSADGAPVASRHGAEAGAPASFFVSNGDEYLPTKLAKGPWGPSLAGNYVGGLLARSVERIVDDPDLQPARITVDLLRPVAPSAVRVQAITVRHGRRLRLVDSVMTQNETLVARASVLFLRRSEAGTGTVWTSPITMPAPPPENGALADDVPMFMWSYGRDPIAGTPGIGVDEWRSDGQKFAWMRETKLLVDDEPLTPFIRTVMAGDVTSSLANWGTDGLQFINADYTLTLSRLPIGLNIGLAAVSHHSQNGVATGSVTFFDRQGPIGIGVSTALAHPGFTPPPSLMIPSDRAE